jgi:excisionase family DNA binding protein
LISRYLRDIVAIMPKQRKRRDDTAALFVRLPLEEAERLDRFAFERRIPKRDVVRTLLAEHLDEADVMWRQPLPPPLPPMPAGAEGVVGRAEFTPADGQEVLTVEQAADLLQVEPGDVAALAEAGELPGRKIGESWRFLRSAVLTWLGGDAPEAKRASRARTERE